MNDDLTLIAEELVKIRFILGAFLILVYLIIVGITIYFAIMNPFAAILSILELLFGFVLLAQYGMLLERLRKSKNEPKSESKK